MFEKSKLDPRPQHIKKYVTLFELKDASKILQCARVKTMRMRKRKRKLQMERISKRINILERMEVV